ncbi:hypothetical protein ACFPK5_00360 [Streptomyces beijiangensis]|uniref:hypothetical protein n=1 Tax=Streptomyces beijiangensis TaxID=163361 RepID=UPI0031D1D1DD
MATDASMATQVLALAKSVHRVEQQVEQVGERGEHLETRLTALDLGPLQEAIDHLEDRTSGLQEDMAAVTKLREALTALGGQVAQLRQDLVALAADPAEEKLALWDWTVMDQQQAHEAWGVLIPWVRDVLAARYGWVGHVNGLNTNAQNGSSAALPRIPPCWYRHETAVWELSWLCQEWHKLYKTSAGTPSKAGDWHDRYAPGVRRRLAAALSSCAKKGAHVEETMENTVLPRGIDDDETMSAFLRWDLDQRQPPPDPGPVPART